MVASSEWLTRIQTTEAAAPVSAKRSCESPIAVLATRCAAPQAASAARP